MSMPVFGLITYQLFWLHSLKVFYQKSAAIAERIGAVKMLLIAIVISGFARVSIQETHNSITPILLDYSSCDAILQNESREHLPSKIELEVFEC